MLFAIDAPPGRDRIVVLPDIRERGRYKPLFERRSSVSRDGDLTIPRGGTGLHPGPLAERMTWAGACGTRPICVYAGRSARERLRAVGRARAADVHDLGGRCAASAHFGDQSVKDQGPLELACDLVPHPKVL